MVRWTAALLHVSIEHAFVAQGVLSLLVLAGFVFFCAARRGTPGWLLVAMVIVPFWPQVFHGLALPDLWYAALLAIFLLFLQRERWLAAACMMLPLMLSRESTSLTLLCFLLAGWRELRWLGWITAVAATGLGAFITSRLAAGSSGNTEHLPGFLYVLLKIPWNLSRLLGISPWSNANQDLCTVPSWQIPLHIAHVTAVGVCGFDSLAPLLAIFALTTTFGLLPLLMFLLWRQPTAKRRRSLLLRFALLYGGVSFVLAPMIGISYPRLLGYAWPLLLVALPLLAQEHGQSVAVQRSRPQWTVFAVAANLTLRHRHGRASVRLGSSGRRPGLDRRLHSSIPALQRGVARDDFRYGFRPIPAQEPAAQRRLQRIFAAVEARRGPLPQSASGTYNGNL